MLARMVFAAAIAGVLGGFLWSAALSMRVVPLILVAEGYEEAAPAAAHTDDPAMAGHVHDGQAWAPADGVERTLYTLVGNVVTATGFALMLVAAFAVRGGASWREGLLWGVAGFATFHLAPALGLPPELPGAAAAELGERQLWWLSTALLTATGLALLILTRDGMLLRALGAVLLVVPHLIGAPQPEIHGDLAPPELARTFVVASLLGSALFWVALGGLSAFFFGLLGRRGLPGPSHGTG